jgi:hypothetical protein
MKKLFAVFLMILAVPTFAADIYMKSKSHTDPVSVAGQNQPAKDTVTEQWIGDGKVAVITATSTTVMDLTKNVQYIVNHKTKSYVETALPLDIASLLPPEMAGLAQSMKMTAKVTPTNNKRTVGTRSCDEYDVSLTMSILPIKLKVCATTDVPFDIRNYTEKVQSGMLRMQMLGLDDASLKELEKIEGLWILTETTGETMGIKIHTTMEVTEITQKPAPDGIYSVPSGYTKQDKLSIQDLQNQ